MRSRGNQLICIIKSAIWCL